MEVWVFGNADLELDALPVRILPGLKKQFPEYTFVHKDPLDEWEMHGELMIIDTVRGISAVTRFTSIDDFIDAPRVTMHDFDLGTQLKFLQKLNKLPRCTILGVPATLTEAEAIIQLQPFLRQFSG
ncbi:MAG: hypothetical protein WC289_01010 [Patescibacteria group bacterium]|jgi:hypothetical protein